MHEMSYVVRMVNLAQKTLEQETGISSPGACSAAADPAGQAAPVSVRKIVVAVGEMTGVIPVYLQRYYPEAVKGTLLEGSVLETEELQAMVRCTDCGSEYHPCMENDYSCPACGSINGVVTQGRDVLLKEVVLEETAPAQAAPEDKDANVPRETE